MTSDDIAEMLLQLEYIANGQDQTRIAEALEDIASLLYSINQKL